MPSSEKLTRVGDRARNLSCPNNTNPDIDALIRQIAALKSRVELLDTEMQHLSDDIEEWETVECMLELTGVGTRRPQYFRITGRHPDYRIARHGNGAGVATTSRINPRALSSAAQNTGNSPEAS
jgi:hypothetical protein